MATVIRIADDGKPLYRPGEAAAILGIGTTQLGRLNRLGRVAAIMTPGGRRRYRRGDLEKYLTERYLNEGRLR